MLGRDPTREDKAWEYTTVVPENVAVVEGTIALNLVAGFFVLKRRCLQSRKG